MMQNFFIHSRIFCLLRKSILNIIITKLIVLINFEVNMSNSAEHRGDWYRDGKLGMFIHWGLYSVSGRGEWAMTRDGVSPKEYAETAKIWNPDVGCEREWVEAAKAAGMRYVILTTRHHDGFSLFDSKAKAAEGSYYDSVHSPAARDHVRAFAEACRAVGIKVGFYYSLADWRFKGPDGKYPVENQPKMKQQAWDEVRQLMTDYGKIDLLWYDGAWHPEGMEVKDFWDSEHLNEMVRSLQPDILINERSGMRQDFCTIEGRNIIRPPEGADLWELCLTLQDDDWSFWGYCFHSVFKKTPEQMLCMLLHCLEVGGNFLINFSPDGHGHLPEWQKDLLAQLGAWVHKHEDAVYGTSPCMLTTDRPLSGGWTGNSCSFFTRKGNRLYGYIHAWPGTELQYPIFKAKAIRAEYMGKELEIEQNFETRHLKIKGFPANPPTDWCPVFTVDVEELKS